MPFVETLFGGSSLAGAGHGTGNLPFNIPSGFGYVVLTSIGSMFLLAWQGIQVGKMRQKLKINYPTMYSADNDLFNCFQRAHQNTLENYSQFLALLLFGGLEMPIFSAIGGVIWIAGRVAYSRGYYTGDPKKRSRGFFGYIGLFMLLGASFKFSYHLLTA